MHQVHIGMGQQFIPRIGQEVLVEFVEGDIDRPIVIGTLYNGRGEAGVPATPGGAQAEAEFAGAGVGGVELGQIVKLIEGDDVWVRSDMAFRAVPTDLTRKAFQVEDLSTYFASLRDVADPRKKAIPTGQVFSDMLNFPPWLEMGDRNGHYFSRCFGR